MSSTMFIMLLYYYVNNTEITLFFLSIGFFPLRIESNFNSHGGVYLFHFRIVDMNVCIDGGLKDSFLSQWKPTYFS